MSAKEKTTGFFAEFRKFIARGSVMDLAVGVIIGGVKADIRSTGFCFFLYSCAGLFSLWTPF